MHTLLVERHYLPLPDEAVIAKIFEHCPLGIAETFCRVFLNDVLMSDGINAQLDMNTYSA